MKEDADARAILNGKDGSAGCLCALLNAGTEELRREINQTKCRACEKIKNFN